MPHLASDASTTEIAGAMAAAGLVPGRSPAPVLLPDPGTLFQRRADRLRRLAAGHPLSAWLEFVAQLSDAQHALATTPLPAPAAPEAQWRYELGSLRDRLRGALPADAADTLDALPWTDPNALDGLAARLTAGALRPDDLKAAPFATAALQVAWTRHAGGLETSTVAAPATAITCPVCGGVPVAGVIHTSGEVSGLRYLHCGLCHTAWHHVRSACVACGEGNRIGLRAIEGTDGPARAETCDACESYLKLLLAEKAPDFDPVADDLASFALDVLVGDGGYAPVGLNPFLAQAGEGPGF